MSESEKRFLGEVKSGNDVHEIEVTCPSCEYEAEFVIDAGYIGNTGLSLLSHCFFCGSEFLVTMTIAITAKATAAHNRDRKAPRTLDEGTNHDTSGA